MREGTRERGQKRIVAGRELKQYRRRGDKIT